MIKLLIADDERIIRETISNIIDWKQYDIEVIGLCKNGIEAYDMILDESPDIVLTDIRMPESFSRPMHRSNSSSYPVTENSNMPRKPCTME